MRSRPVHWSEGMLVLPHHFQAHQSQMLDWLATSADWHTPYNYGLHGLEYNESALANFEVRVPTLRARLKDGSLISVPENAHLATLDLRPAFEDSPELFIHLVLPEIELGRPNATRLEKSPGERYLIQAEEWEDRNVGGNPRPIEAVRFNAQLVALKTIEAPKGYESIPIMKVRRSQQADAKPELDTNYIPPLLATACWKPLRESILIAIRSQLGAYIKTQAEYLQTHGGWTEANQAQIRKSIMQLFAVNSTYPYLTQLTEAQGVHPFLAYTELCRLVGQLAIQRDDWMPPDLPIYDHDDLGRIFREIKIQLDVIFKEEIRAKVQRYPFIGVQEWMEVSLDPRWLRGSYGFYVGVRSDLTPERLELLFSDRWLDWKLGSSRTVSQIFKNGEAGLSLSRVTGIHQSLPALKNVTYFQVDPRGRYWEQCVESRTLALTVNRNYVNGDFVGQNSITVVDPRGNPRDLMLELFLVENE